MTDEAAVECAFTEPFPEPSEPTNTRISATSFRSLVDTGLVSSVNVEEHARTLDALEAAEAELVVLRDELQIANERGDAWRDKFNADTEKLARISEKERRCDALETDLQTVREQLAGAVELLRQWLGDEMSTLLPDEPTRAFLADYQEKK